MIHFIRELLCRFCSFPKADRIILTLMVISFCLPTPLTQVRIVARSDVLFAMHGAAQTHLLLLPPWGVSVELFALGHGSDERSETAGEDARMSFYYGYCNWARLASRTHIT